MSKPFKMQTAAELNAEIQAERAARSRKPGKWGPWHLNRKTLCLELRDSTGKWRYEIDLTHCATAASCLDWIAHVAQKRSMTPEIVGYMVKALQDLLDIIPALVCGDLVEGGGDVKALLRRTGWIRAGRGAKA